MPPCLVRLVGSHQAEDTVRLVGVAGPDLLAIDDEVVAGILRGGLQAGEVGACTGFRIALAPADFAPHDLGQVLLLLRLRAVLQQGRAQHGDAEGVEGAAAPELSHFLAQHLGLRRAEAAAAVGGRPVRRGPAARGHAVQPLALRLAELRLSPAPDHVGVAAHRRAHLRRAVGLQPGVRLRAEGLERVDHGVHVLNLPPSAALDFSRADMRKALSMCGAFVSSPSTTLARPTVSAQNIGPPVQAGQP